MRNIESLEILKEYYEKIKKIGIDSNSIYITKIEGIGHYIFVASDNLTDQQKQLVRNFDGELFRYCLNLNFIDKFLIYLGIKKVKKLNIFVGYIEKDFVIDYQTLEEYIQEKKHTIVLPYTIKTNRKYIPQKYNYTNNIANYIEYKKSPYSKSTIPLFTLLSLLSPASILIMKIIVSKNSTSVNHRTTEKLNPEVIYND